MLDETVKVIVAWVDCPGDRVVPSLFHVTVNGPLAPLGLQFDVVMFKVRETPLPVFLMYTVCVFEAPGVKLPQPNEDRGDVQAESE